MPELPEVETIKRGLRNIENKKITQIFRSNKKMRFDSSLDLSLLEGGKVKYIDRRARYLILGIDEKYCLIIHLGMSGRLTFCNLGNKIDNYEIQKHDHFIAELENNEILILNDPRRFGFVDLIHKEDLKNHKMLENLGPEPLDQSFDENYLYNKIKNKITNIKTTMMDNKIVVGVGNIYINESLFVAKISPLRSAKTLRKSELKKLVEAIKSILEAAITSGGSSINDYVDSSGNLGSFQNNFKIYGLENGNCLECENVIQRIVQNGRSTFYCSKCQK